MEGIKEYMANNAGWLVLIGIGVAALVLLALIGLLYTVRHYRQQVRALEQINEKLGGMANEAQQAADLAALAAEAPSYEEVVDQFFAETSVKTPQVPSVTALSRKEDATQRISTPVAEAAVTAAAVADEALAATKPDAPETAPAPREMAAPSPGTAASIPHVADEPVFDFSAFKANLENAANAEDRLYDTARSGRRYSRAELEHQIKG